MLVVMFDRYFSGGFMMKKFVSVFLCAVLILGIFSACGKNKVFDGANETFSSLPAYSEGEIISANFSSACSIKIKDNNYENFADYVQTLKKAGFEYLPFGSAPENYSLSNGSALWRCSNEEICLQIMFNEDGTPGYKAFGCNIQIFGYDEMPDSWAESADKTESTEKSK